MHMHTGCNDHLGTFEHKAINRSDFLLLTIMKYIFKDTQVFSKSYTIVPVGGGKM